MCKLVKALALSGLAICAGPFSLKAYAQGYVDLEAERAGQIRPDGSSAPGIESAGAVQNSSVATDPYGASPAVAYPATSYGVDTVAAPAPTMRPAQAAAASGGSDSGQNLSNLFYQLQQLQQEVMMLNGKVEEQAHELRKIKAQNLERYVDIDRRLGNGSAAVAVTTTVENVPVRNTGSDPAVAELPGEGEAYRAAYALVRAKQFSEGVTAFEKFLNDYPGGKYSPNAYYWLGELNLVIKPANPESARQAFMLLLNQYPNNNKIPDALYKLGKVQYTKGNRDKAKEFLERVINEYGSTNSSAVTLAKGFLRDNY
ncbi:MAG: tol-pal system protein YbgF [Halioglobus sp.]|jgi:tol-pal system protein YbgF